MIFLWIALYGMAYRAGTFLEKTLTSDSWALPAVMAAYCLGFVLWIHCGGHRQFGLAPVGFTALRQYPQAWVLLLLPAYNLLVGGFPVCAPEQWVLCFCTAFAEELFFRGYLLSCLESWRSLPRLAAVSLAFALLHGANLLAGVPPYYVALQMLAALLTGFLYGCAALRLKSILPGTAAHFLGNITGIQGRLDHIGFFILLSAACCLWAGYDIWLKEKERQ